MSNVVALHPEPELQHTTPQRPKMTATDLAALLAVSVTRIYQLRHEGALPPAIKIGRTVRWDPDDVDAWLEASKEKS